MVTGVLGVCHLMPGSGAVYGGALTALLLPKNWEKATTELEQRHFLSVQSLRAQQGWRVLISFFSCFLCLCSKSTRKPPLQVIGNHDCDMLQLTDIDRTPIDSSTLLPRYANKTDGKAWCRWNMMELEETACQVQSLQLICLIRWYKYHLVPSGTLQVQSEIFPTGKTSSSDECKQFRLPVQTVAGFQQSPSVTATAQILVNSGKRCVHMCAVNADNIKSYSDLREKHTVRNPCLVRSWKPML